jgi:hypothetical protein
MIGPRQILGRFDAGSRLKVFSDRLLWRRGDRRSHRTPASVLPKRSARRRCWMWAERLSCTEPPIWEVRSGRFSATRSGTRRRVARSQRRRRSGSNRNRNSGPQIALDLHAAPNVRADPSAFGRNSPAAARATHLSSSETTRRAAHAQGPPACPMPRRARRGLPSPHASPCRRGPVYPAAYGRNGEEATRLPGTARDP